MKQLDKNGVAVKLSSEKKLKKIYETLKMFPKEKINPADRELLETGKFPSGVTLTEWIGEAGTAFIHFDGEDWRMDCETEGKLTIKHKQLRNLLYAEHCKEGDYIICRNVHYGDLNSDIIVKFKSSDFTPDRDGDYIVNYSRAYCTKDERQLNHNWLRGYFVRYATQKEIDLLEGKKEKIAVKVDNEKEFNALMKYYDSFGWKWASGHKPSEINSPLIYPDFVRVEDKFTHTRTVGYNESKGYKIIHFSEFAKEHGIRVPLLVSEDGVELFEGDAMQLIYKLSKGYEWSLEEELKPASQYQNVNKLLGEHKAFSAKQAALDWIKTQNPSYSVNEYGDDTRESKCNTSANHT